MNSAVLGPVKSVVSIVLRPETGVLVACNRRVPLPSWDWALLRQAPRLRRRPSKRSPAEAVAPDYAAFLPERAKRIRQSPRANAPTPIAAPFDCWRRSWQIAFAAVGSS